MSSEEMHIKRGPEPHRAHSLVFEKAPLLMGKVKKTAPVLYVDLFWWAQPATNKTGKQRIAIIIITMTITTIIPVITVIIIIIIQGKYFEYKFIQRDEKSSSEVSSRTRERTRGSLF